MYKHITPFGETVIKCSDISLWQVRTLNAQIESLIESAFEKGLIIKEITIERKNCPVCGRSFNS